MLLNMNNDNNREKTIYKVTLIGSLSNFALLGFKAVAGIVGHSPAMIADAVHSMSDFITDIFVLFFVRLSNKPQDSGHEYGHGKYETLATSLIGISLLGVGVFILSDAAQRIWSVINGATLAKPGGIALVAAIVSILTKELLFQYTVVFGKKLNSQAVIANAWHHRSDALSSIATLIGIAGAIFLGDKWVVLDPIAAMIVSILIIKVAIDLLRENMGDLLEQALPEETERQIIDIIKKYQEIDNIHNFRTRRIGNRNAIDVHVRMDGMLTVLKSHAITRAIEIEIKELLGRDTIINIHVEPK